MDNSIKNFEKKVTLFYSPTTGDIKLHAGGIQDMSYFGPERDDYNYKFIVVDKDDVLLNNLENFKVENGKLKLKNNDILAKYM